jgi:hypothetical protein
MYCGPVCESSCCAQGPNVRSSTSVPIIRLSVAELRLSSLVLVNSGFAFKSERLLGFFPWFLRVLLA